MSTRSNNLRRSTRLKAQVRETDDNEDCHRPITSQRELFAADDVSGNRYYGFSSERNVMARKNMLIRTPANAINLKDLSEVNIMLDTTEVKSPRRGTVNRATTITRTARRERVVSDFSSTESDSEFVPSDDEESVTDDDQIPDNENENSENEDKMYGKVLQVGGLPTTPTRSEKHATGKKMIAYSDFHLKTDAYFTSQGAKGLTSDRTLARLKEPRSYEEQLTESVRNLSQLPRLHTQAVHGLCENHRTFFPMWLHIMEEGYSLLLHGLGSKRDLINNFYNEIAMSHPALIINGFFPSLNVKDILDGIVAELLDLERFPNSDECFNLIEETLMHNFDDRLYMLIHNIDAEMLRSSKAQDTLSRLAAIPNVRLLASIDHINAPLMWDNVKRSRFNFYWFDATTLLPYKAETSYENSLLVQRSSTLALSSLYNVFQSLTTNTKAIYMILVRHQLKNERDYNHPGMAFKDLYQSAREGFLVSSDLVLRAQLIEFIDHKLVRMKRIADGAEYLIIPLNNALLQQFIDREHEH